MNADQRRWKSIWLAGAAILAATLPAHGQSTTPSPAELANLGPRGFAATGNYSIDNIESIDNVYGGVSYNIPLASLPPGRAGMSLGLSLTYNSNFYDVFYFPYGSTLYNILAPAGGGGWQYAYDYQLEMVLNPGYAYGNVQEQGNCNSAAGVSVFKYYQLFAIFPDGSHHLLHLYGAQDDNGNGFYQELPGSSPTCTHYSTQSGNFTYFTDDGTFLTLVFDISTYNGSPAPNPPPCGSGNPTGWSAPCWTGYNWTMFLADGRRVTGIGLQPTAIKDPNGNQIALSNIDNVGTGGSPATVMEDDLHRQISVAHVLGTGGNPQDVIQQTGANNSTLTWTVTWGSSSGYAGATYTGCPPPPFMGACTVGAFPAISSVAFPADSQGFAATYSFGYNTFGWGQLNSVTLPSGATVNYCYQYDPASTSNVCGGIVPMSEYPLTPPRNPVLRKVVTWCDESDQAMPVSSCSTPTQYRWNYQFPGTLTTSSVTGPDGGTTTTTFNNISTSGSTPSPTAGLVTAINYPDGSSVSRSWAQNAPYETTTGTNYSPANPYVAGETRMAAGSAATATRAFSYDNNGNLLSGTESDWNGPTLRTTTQTLTTPTATATPPGSTADNGNAYWNPSFPPLHSLVFCRSITGSGNGAVTEFGYDNRGNVTQERDWNSKLSGQPTCSNSAQLSSGNAVVLNRTYDGNGNLTDAQDGTDTHFVYDSTYNVLLTNVYNAYGNALQRVTNYSLDFNTGLVNSQTDYNGLTQNYTRDGFGRAIQVLESGASGLLRETTTSYEDQARRVITRTDNADPGDQQLAAVTDYDWLGRVRLTRQLESAGQSADDDTAGIKVQTRYGYGNFLSYQIVSNPYRADKSSDAGGEATMGWTLAASATNQAASIVTPSGGATVPSPPSAITCPASGTATGSQTACSSGNATKVTDELGVQRVNTTDGLGRLTSVLEAGISATTNYSYDVLGNLTGVSPGGYAGRSFTYDSLGRLYQASNPESGTTNYAYDNNSNLVSRTDGRGVMTCYGMISGSTCSSTIDALNRVTAKAYSGGMAPSVSYSYSGGTDFLISVSSSASTYTYANYDELARPHAGTQTTAGQSYTFAAVGWTPQGQMGSITYPSGRTVTTSFDLAGRISGVQGRLNSGQTQYVSNTAYAAPGALSGMTTGDGLTRTMGYDARLRNNSITNGSWLSVGLNWNANGTLQSQAITRPGLSATQSYGYDGVNRLTSASEPGNWSQGYLYDNVGNRSVTAGSTVLAPNFTPTSTGVFNAKNQWTGTAGVGVGYDQAGNLTSVSMAAVTESMSYDAESRMTSWTNGSTSVSFTYDGNGNRVSKTAGTTTTVYVYDPAGNLAVEYGGNTPSTTGTLYLTQDHLGSTRLVTNTSGCVGAHDYLPFGEEIPGSGGYGRNGVSCYGAADTEVKFTGQERDPETAADLTGFDNFLARMFAGSQGRFLSPDPDNAGADATNPQSWNMYGYVWNNPLTMIDPTGLYGYCQYGTAPGGNSCQPPPWVTTTIWELSSGLIGGPIPQPPAPPALPLPPQRPKTPSLWDCVRGDTDYFSLQNILKSASNGKLGSSWLAGAFLGNSVQSVGDTIQAVGSLDFGRAADVAGAEALGDTTGSVLTSAASKVPNVAITVGIQVAASVQTPVSSRSIGLAAQAGARLPTGALAQAGASAVSKGLGVLGLVKLPYDLTIASFSGLVCGIGR